MFPVHHKAKLVGVARIELAIAPLSAESFTTKPYPKVLKIGWSERNRTSNNLINNQAFCQLNYTPTIIELVFYINLTSDGRGNTMSDSPETIDVVFNAIA